MIAALREARQPLTVGEIIIEAEQVTRNAADILLSKMAKDGEVVRVKKGRYSLPSQDYGQMGQMDRSNGQPVEIISKTN